MWYDNDYRRVFMDMHINDSNPEYLSKLDVKDFVKTMKEAEVTSVVVKAKSHVACITGRVNTAKCTKRSKTEISTMWEK